MVKRILFKDVHPSDVILPAFGAPSHEESGSKAYMTWLFIIRILIIIWVYSVVIWNWVKYGDWEVYFCYLTQWGWWMEGITMILVCCVCIIT